MATVDLTLDTFDQTASAEGIVIVDFWAEWCGPCRSFAPVFSEASEKHDDIVFAKVDTEAEQAIASSFNITSIPTLMVFRDGVIVFHQAGALPGPVLEQLIEQVRALDMNEVHRQIAEQQQQQAATGEAAQPTD